MFALFFCGLALADMITPVSPLTSIGGAGGISPDRLIDGPVVTEANYATTGQADSYDGVWFTPVRGTDYFEPSPATLPEIGMPLDQAYLLTDIIIWGYVGANAPTGVTDFDLYFSTDGGTTETGPMSLSLGVSPAPGMAQPPVTVSSLCHSWPAASAWS